MTDSPGPDRPAPALGADPTRDVRLTALPRLSPPTAASQVDQETDELSPPANRPRERTLAFSSPEMGQRPVGPVTVGRNSRRWPWVVLTLLPILVIVGAGLAWLVLLRTM